MQQKKASIVNNIQPLLQSPLIESYLIGITKKPTDRHKSYLREGFPFFYILATELSQQEAIEIERDLFTFLTSDKDSFEFIKYHQEKREKSYKPSTGGVKESTDIYCVYVAAF